MLDVGKRAAARYEPPIKAAATSEPPLVTLAQSCQSALADDGFWLERYGSSLGCIWARFRRVLREDADGVCTQVFLLAHDAENQDFLADEYLVQEHGLVQESQRREVWHYLSPDDLPATMREVLATVQAWAQDAGAA